MTTTAVTDQINDHISLELLAVGKGDFCHVQYRFGVIPVDVEYRSLDSFCDIRGVDRGPGIVRQRRKAHLIVHDHVHGAARAIRTKLRHLQSFEHDALTRHSGITVDENRQNSKTTNFFAVLFRANNPFKNAIHGFEVGGVGS